MPLFELSRSLAAPEKRLPLEHEAVDGEDIDRQEDDKDKVDDVIQKIQSARVIDRLVDKARQNELERRR